VPQPAGVIEYRQSVRGVTEAVPGTRWQERFATLWPGHRRWYLQPDGTLRPTRAVAERMLERFMPELAPTYHRLVSLAGDDDTAAAFLTLWDPPRFQGLRSQVRATPLDGLGVPSTAYGVK
jgi:hypothetical protein